MGLKDALINAVSSAVTATGNIAESVIYRVKGDADYDVYSGQIEDVANDHTIKAIVSIASEDFRSGVISSGNTGELNVLFSSKGLTFIPKSNDWILIGSAIHKISKVDSDPAGASYTLTVRKVG